MKKSTLLLTTLFFSLACFSQRTDKTFSSFDTRLVELRQRIDTVATALQQAEGLAQTAGLIDLQVAKYFADYIAWELGHPDIMNDALAANQKTLTPAQRDQRYHDHIDDNIGEILKQLDSLGLKENTLVIIASDQGMRYRGMNNPPEVNNHGLPDDVLDFRHKVFCMMRYPALQQQAIKTKALTGIIDIAPTIIDLCGIKIPENIDGKSLKPFITQTNEWDHNRTLIVQCPRSRKRTKYTNASIKTNKWRLLNGELLFDALEDPGLSIDIAAKHPHVVDSLNLIYNNFWESLPEEPILARHILGAENAPEIRLNAMDWYKGDSPHLQSQIASKRYNGTWPVTIAYDGLYHLELRSFPREHPQPILADKATIKIGKKIYSKHIDPKLKKNIFELKLKEGQYDLSTAFESGSDDSIKKSWGAYFVYSACKKTLNQLSL